MHTQFKIMIAACAMLVLSACQTTSKTVDFQWKGDDRRIVLMPTDIELSLMSGGGVTVPKAKWTADAKKHFLTSLKEKMSSINANVVVGQDGLEQPPEQVSLVKLHEVVGITALTNKKLPTKVGDGKDTWTLGPSVSKIKEMYGSDYALFIYIRDSYTSGERVAAIIVAAAFGVGIQGGSQRGYASLVDLNTGDIVWQNYIFRTNGNMRTLEGTRETADKILAGFPESGT